MRDAQTGNLNEQKTRNKLIYTRKRDSNYEGENTQTEKVTYLTMT